MSRYVKILFYCLLLLSTANLCAQSNRRICFAFYDGTFNADADTLAIVDPTPELSVKNIKNFYDNVNADYYKPLIKALLSYKEDHQLDDWLYYQLVRKTVQQISPKEKNYSKYTLYKWFLMVKSGYDARLALAGKKIIFYVYNNEDISDIPSYTVHDKKYMCLNIHDYPGTDLTTQAAVPVDINVPGAINSFSYKVTRMPDFTPTDYVEKDLQFTYRHKAYYFRIKLNPLVDSIFRNYPVVDFESYFNIPLSKETYGSLIPLLKKNVGSMNITKGVDYLMHFTRYAFLYENDDMNFGREKRLSPEETLFAQYSDCDDRAALFFYLVKEIYNLPMIAVLYPTHITMAVQFDKPVGKPLFYKGKAYSFCEPTPQLHDLKIGQVSASLKQVPYKVVYEYNP
ncbi:hypothetical protein SNE26_09960 [Mucilaginibacter sp. cycad4]|uniref:hypothetical protein n=1 Tax=Mucilaginibacter sp. cycad4 TaxID=3342096 RepID=UPI002AABA5FF|nr:hypothetical protein [Mucilaginibacter gossypii]WPV02100.1 hypothetical protein SNE26_09960 [Mucilaginibacter gossypii]